MKTKLLAIIVGLLGLTLLSCEREPYYSCDPSIDIWTKANLSSIKQMTRSSFVHISPNYQKAAFRAFSPEQRLDVWKQKIDEILLLDWK